MIYKLEDLAQQKLKVPLISKNTQADNYKINRNDKMNLEISKSIPTVAGVIKNVDNQMADVLKHDYLRRSLE